MRVVVDHDGVRLDEAEVFTAFDVRRRGDVDLAAALARHGWGSVTATGDVMVSVAALRAAGPADDGWRAGLDGMLGYAATKGWLDDARLHVQAHVIDEP
jgi:hypothetical protein